MSPTDKGIDMPMQATVQATSAGQRRPQRTGGGARAAAGFTLIELIVTVAIAGILAVIAIPSYVSYVQQGKRPEAKTALLDLASREERYYTVNNTYSSSASALGYGAAAAFPINLPVSTAATGDYQLSVSASSATAYTLAATASGQQVNDGCGSYGLNNLGVQTVTGALGTSACW